MLEAYRARLDSRLGRELFYVGFRVEETTWCNGQGCGAPSPRGRGSIPSWVKSTFKFVSEWKKKGLESCNRFEELNK